MMTQHRAISRTKLAGGVVLGAVAFGLATTALGTAGSANATCASISGINNGHGCTSSPGSAAFGLGANATATADGGPLNLAVAVGNPGPNPFYGGAVLPTQALARGTFNGAFAIGSGTNAGSLGVGNSAIGMGSGSNAFSYGGPRVPNPQDLSDYLSSNFNTSIVLGNNSEAGAVGPAHELATAFGNNKRGLNNGLKPAPPSN